MACRLFICAHADLLSIELYSKRFIQQKVIEKCRLQNFRYFVSAPMCSVFVTFQMQPRMMTSWKGIFPRHPSNMNAIFNRRLVY